MDRDGLAWCWLIKGIRETKDEANLWYTPYIPLCEAKARRCSHPVIPGDIQISRKLSTDKKYNTQQYPHSGYKINK